MEEVKRLLALKKALYLCKPISEKLLQKLYHKIIKKKKKGSTKNALPIFLAFKPFNRQQTYCYGKYSKNKWIILIVIYPKNNKYIRL